jgi:hypothetical protein
VRWWRVGRVRLFSSLTNTHQFFSPTRPPAASASITRARAAAMRGGCSGKDGAGGRRKPAAQCVDDIRAASGASAAEEGGRKLPGSHAGVVQETVEDPISEVLSGQLIPVALLDCVRPVALTRSALMRCGAGCTTRSLVKKNGKMNEENTLFSSQPCRIRSLALTLSRVPPPHQAPPLPLSTPFCHLPHHQHLIRWRWSV